MFCFMKASSKAVDNSAAVMDTLLIDWYVWFPLTYTDTAGWFLWITTAKCTQVPFWMETSADAQFLVENKYANQWWQIC